MRIRNKSVQIEGNPISIAVSTVFDVNLDQDESETWTGLRQDRDEVKLRFRNKSVQIDGNPLSMGGLDCL
jgi:hypothetical protein